MRNTNTGLCGFAENSREVLYGTGNCNTRETLELRVGNNISWDERKWNSSTMKVKLRVCIFSWGNIPECSKQYVVYTLALFGDESRRCTSRKILLRRDLPVERKAWPKLRVRVQFCDFIALHGRCAPCAVESLNVSWCCPARKRRNSSPTCDHENAHRLCRLHLIGIHVRHCSS